MGSWLRRFAMGWCALLAVAVVFSGGAAFAGDELQRLEITGMTDPWHWSSSVSEDLVIVGGEDYPVDTATIYRRRGIIYEKEAELTSSDFRAGDYFGYSVAVCGDTALVGAMGANLYGMTDVGAVYVYRFDGSSWVEETRLLSSEPASQGRFGYDLALDERRAVVASLSGTYVFRHDASEWIEEARLPSGSSVSLYRNLIAIGDTTFDSATQSGGIHVYRFDGSSWVHEETLVGTPGSRQGLSVTLFRDVVAGASKEDVLVHRFDGSSWVREATLSFPPPVYSPRPLSPSLVSEDRLLIGDPNYHRVRVYLRDGSNWTEGPRMEPADLRDYTDSGSQLNHKDFGSRVSSCGNLVLVETQIKPFPGASWHPRACVFLAEGTLPHEDAIILRGSESFAAGDGVVVLGNEDALSERGAVYVYRQSGADWAQEAALLASDAEDGTHLGHCVAVDGDLVAAIADGDHSVYVFRYSAGSWSEEAKLVPSTPETLTAHLALDGDLVVLGANEGRLHVFRFDGAGWTEEAVLAPWDSTPLHHYYDLALSGDRIAITHRAVDGPDGTYVFRRDPDGWVPETKLPAGSSVALEGEDLLVGVPWEESLAGAVYCYRRAGTSWTATGRMTPPDARKNNEFGHALGISGGQAIVGCQHGRDGDRPAPEGEAWLAARVGGEWRLRRRLLPAAPRSDDFIGPFGSRVSLCNATALVVMRGEVYGASSAYVFHARQDADGDDLWFVDELAHGTDPQNPDTDLDRLDDGAEVALSAGRGCPDPRIADSDGDDLPDGDEVLGGTDPCWPEGVYNTPAGRDIEVAPVDPVTGSSPVTLTFAEVITEGQTYVRTGTTGPDAPDGFLPGEPPLYLEVFTTAAFAGSVEISVDYSGTTFGNDSALRIFHYEAGAWTDVTTAHDPESRLISATVESLSTFLVAEPANGRPVADAGEDREVVQGAAVLLTGSAQDPDGDPIEAWRWSVLSSPAGSDAQWSAIDIAAPVFFPDLPGTYVLTLEASDGTDWSRPDPVTILVRENQPPVAVIETDLAGGEAPLQVRFDGTGSFDPEGAPLTYEWDFDDGSGPATEATPTHLFERPGDYLVRLTVTDDRGLADETTALISIADTTPPEVLLSAGPATLWPPSHAMVAVEWAGTVADSVDPAPAAVLRIESDEVDGGPEDPGGDIRVRLTDGSVVTSSNEEPVVTVAWSEVDRIELRAERLGDGDGRVYTLTLMAEDASGNTASATALISVSHDSARAATLVAQPAEAAASALGAGVPDANALADPPAPTANEAGAAAEPAGSAAGEIPDSANLTGEEPGNTSAPPAGLDPQTGQPGGQAGKGAQIDSPTGNQGATGKLAPAEGSLTDPAEN